MWCAGSSEESSIGGRQSLSIAKYNMREETETRSASMAGRDLTPPFGPWWEEYNHYYPAILTRRILSPVCRQTVWSH
jgi:hypothetical protein